MTIAARPQKSSRLRLFVRELLEPYDWQPGTSRLSLLVDVAVLVLIIASIALIPLELMHPELAPALWRAEQIFTGVFVVEYLLRWYAAPSRLRYPFTFYALIDLLAILPTLLLAGVEFMAFRAARGLRLLRVFRLVRVVRLFRFVRYSYLLARVLVRSRIWLGALIHRYRLRQISKLAMWVGVALVLGANLLHMTERHLVGNQGPYADYWRSYWNVVIVLVSGIEDKEPLSLLGRVEITALLIVGIVTVGMLTGEIVGILVNRVQRSGRLTLLPPRVTLEQHIVVLGHNAHFERVVHEVVSALSGRHYVLLVCSQAEELRSGHKPLYRHVFALAGDPTDSEVLSRASIDRAFRVIVLAEPDEDNAAAVDDRSLMRALAVRGHSSTVPLVVELLASESLIYAQHIRGADFVLSQHVGERLIALSALQPGITSIFDELMTFTYESSEFYSVPVSPRQVGRSFAEIQLEHLDADREPVVPVGIDRSPAEAPGSRLYLAPRVGKAGLDPHDLVLGAQDRLVYMALVLPSFAHIESEDLWDGRVLLSG